MKAIDKVKLLNKIHCLKNAKGEDAITNQISLFLRASSLDGTLKGIWFHVPNESVVSENNRLTDVIRIQRKQALGLINGAPDFVFISPRRSIFIEVKTNVGYLSEFQKIFKSWCEDEGVGYFVARSLDDVKRILRDQYFMQS